MILSVTLKHRKNNHLELHIRNNIAVHKNEVITVSYPNSVNSIGA